MTIDWDKYLDIRWLNENNSGSEKFFESIILDLSEEDLMYMREQASYNSIKHWRKNHITSFKIVRDKKRIDYFKYSKFKLSQPVFNADFSYSILFEEYIGGMGNGSFCLRIFKRYENSWKEIAFVQLWIS